MSKYIQITSSWNGYIIHVLIYQELPVACYRTDILGCVWWIFLINGLAEDIHMLMISGDNMSRGAKAPWAAWSVGLDNLTRFMNPEKSSYEHAYSLGN